MANDNPYGPPPPGPPEIRIEVVIVCVGFEELLDITLTYNHGHFDTVIVVTTIEDKATQKVANKRGAVIVQTDLFKKNGRNFNKGAAINAGFSRFQYNGWRMVQSRHASQSPPTRTRGRTSCDLGTVEIRENAVR